jgi:hypothetical protein
LRHGAQLPGTARQLLLTQPATYISFDGCPSRL